MRAQMRGVGLLARGIDDQQQLLAHARGHEVVEDAAGRIRELGVAHAARLQAADVAGHEPLQRLGGVVEIVRSEADLAHMRDIEEPRRAPRVLMLGDDSGRVLHRHLVASERHDFRPQLAMQIEERRALQRCGRGHGVRRSSGLWRAGRPFGSEPCLLAPSVAGT
jgi:hypothetical protein